jgi:hypothetical protein
MERLAERSSAREKLPLDLRWQIIPTHNHCRPQTMQNVVFFLIRAARFSQSASRLPPSFSHRVKARTSRLFVVEAFHSLPIMRHPHRYPMPSLPISNAS